MPALNDTVAGNAVSPNFKWGEVVAAKTQQDSDALWTALLGDSVAQQNAESLATFLLQPIRDDLGGRIEVTSWYRTPEHNAAVEGAPQSLHLIAAAADIVPMDNTLAELQASCEKFRPMLQELIVYPNDGHIHIGMASTFVLGKVLTSSNGTYATISPTTTVQRLATFALIGGLGLLAALVLKGA